MGNKGQVLNEAEVDFLLAASAANQEPPPPAAETRDSQTVTMRGDLEQINLADIFQTLAMSKMEGLLVVRNPLEERQVYCNNGSVRIRVPARLAIRRLGQRLVQAGLLQSEQLRATLVLQRKEPIPLGELLVKQGLLTQDQIDEVAGMQVAEDLFALFTWKHGTFEFYKGELSDPAQRAQFEICPEFEVNSLLLEVARRSDEWDGILQAIGSLDEVPRRIADPPPGQELDDAQSALLYSVDGAGTYRDLADQTTFPLFEAARAARDLVNSGLLANVSESELVAVATEHAAAGQDKRALLMLQTLRDRPGTRSLEIVRAMAETLEKAGEKRLAGTVLLEAAQQHPDPEQALALARRARDLAPNDAGTISFLRTTLLAHASPDSAELEKTTLDLLDALIEADLTTTALEIVQDARTTGTARPQILLREAKARQKARDTQGAVRVLLELAETYQGQNERLRALETYEAVLRLDRSRKDVQKIVSQMRQTRLGRIARVTAMIAGSVLLGGMGIVFWRQSSFEASVGEADAEISAMLEVGDRDGARARLAHWRERLGDCEPVVDLASRIDFAEAAERTRAEKLVRRQVTDALTRAGETFEKGDLRTAFSIYHGVWTKDPFRDEVVGVVTERVEVMLLAIEQAAKAMAHGMPPEPSSLFDRRDLTDRFADLNAICPPQVLRVFEELARMQSTASWPEFMPEPQRQRVGTLVTDYKPLFARAAELAAAYAEALQRNEHQRRLDPLFKAAVEREAAFDFRAALDLYRQLEAEPAGDEQMRTHFRDQVARNAKICSVMDAIQAATDAGNFEQARQLYQGLRTTFPGVPFDRLVRLPLRVESRPAGGTVTCNGKQLGRAPLVVAYVPAAATEVVVTIDGYRAAKTTITGDTAGAWIGNLVAEPQRRLRFDRPVEVEPARDDAGRFLFVDRGGVVTAIDGATGDTVWRFESGDLSGLLGRPLVHEGSVLVTSLDGDLRALDRARGTLHWSLTELPTETGAALVDNYLLVATTDRTLHAIDVTTKTQLRVPLPQASCDRVVAHGRIVVVGGERGTIAAWSLPELTPTWQRELAGVTQPWLVAAGGSLVIADDAGHVRCLECNTGDVRWSKDLGTETQGRPAVADRTVLVSTAERIVRIDLASGAERDGIDRPNEAWAGGAIVLGQRLVTPVADGSLQVVDLATGAFLYRLDGSKRGGRALATGTCLFVAQADRTLHLFTALP